MDFSTYGVPSPEWQAFVEQHPELGQRGRVPPDLTAEELRRQTNAARENVSSALCEAHGLNEQIATTDHQCPTRDGSIIYIREYRPRHMASSPLPVLVHFHGGGYLFGSLDSERYLCASLSFKCGIIVFHVCYRHTPEFTHPTAHNDGHDGLNWILNHATQLHISTEDIVVSGLSAGAAVAAGATLAALSNGGSAGNIRVKGLILGIPWLLHKEAFPVDLFVDPKSVSPEQCADAPIISQEYIDFFTSLLKVEDAADPLLNIHLRSRDELLRLPKTALIVSGMDPLRDGGLILAERLKQLGTPSKVHIFTGLPHGFRRFSELRSARRFDEIIFESVRWALESRDTVNIDEGWIVEGSQGTQTT